jgi:polyribonucleotide nucleotidyltransferase
MREKILKDKKRVDGRGLEDVRQITCEVGFLPRTHGSALFTRGETQSIAVTTLGTSDDEQRIETLSGDDKKRFMLHYTFPPYSVGEARMLRGPGRREIGHGNLAERSLKVMIPKDYKYTIRITSDITESNGSSSMASICGGCLSLMDAGVPIETPVAGISVGLIEDGDNKVLLTDIVGDEDHHGDMDFKVGGTEKGITGVQVDLKIHGLEPEYIAEILERSRQARLQILDTMKETLAASRDQISKHAPAILTTKVPVAKIGTIIGPSGKNIRKIQEETNTHISIDDDGLVQIAADTLEQAEAGKAMVDGMIAEAELGKIYEGPVVRLMTFGAFVKILPEIDGMVHISQISEERIEKIEDALNVGDMVKVRVMEIDDKGRVNLTMKNLDKPFNPDDVPKRRPPAGRDNRHGDRRRSRH